MLPLKNLWAKYSYTIILFVLLLGSLFIININIPNSSEQYITITVKNGDSLWKISQQFEDQHGLTEKEFVKWVEKYNSLTGEVIHSGDQIIIPISEKQLDLDDYQELASY